MAKTAMIRARVEPGLKRQAETIFTQLGLSATEAITLFYTQVTLQHAIPFAVRVPNADTRDALRQAHESKDLVEYRSIDQLKTKFE